MRIKRSVTSHKKKKKYIKAAKGYSGAVGRRYSLAKQQFYRSGAYAYQGRKKKKVTSEGFGLQELMQQQEMKVLNTTS